MNPVKAVEMHREDAEEKRDPIERRNTSEYHPLSLEDTPAYRVLRSHGLLINKYRIDTDIGGAPQIDSVPANSSACTNLALNVLCCPCKPCFRTFTVPAGQVRLVEDGRGGYEFHAQGVHLIC